jgi:hypothetical protein
MLVGMTAPVDQLMRNAVKARQRAQTAIGDAVRQARAAGWSWDRVSSALGGSPSPEALRRTFAAVSAENTAEEIAHEPGEGSCCGGGCQCAGTGR